MGDEDYRVDLEQLDDAIVTMVDFGESVQDWLDQVDKAIADLHLSWESKAAAAQHESHWLWMQGAAEMKENLDELREVARKAHVNYTGAIEINRRMWP